MRNAAAAGPEAEQDALVRWGRGMSYHELELVFEDLPRHIVASSWDPELLAERDVHRAELALQRVLDDARPDLAAAFSRYWLDFILSVEPVAEPRRFLRPWPLRTSGSRGASFEVSEAVLLDGDDAFLRIDLPSPSARLVVGSDPEQSEVSVRQDGSGAERKAAFAPAGIAAYADLALGEPATGYEVRLSGPGTVSLVLYEG